MISSQNDIQEAAQYGADIFGTLIGMKAYVRNLSLRHDFDGTSASMEITLVPNYESPQR